MPLAPQNKGLRRNKDAMERLVGIQNIHPIRRRRQMGTKFWPVNNYSAISQHNLYSMDKKIYTLLTIFIIYFVTAVSMSLFPGAQKVLTALIFGGLGIVLFLGAFMIWVLNRKNEG